MQEVVCLVHYIAEKKETPVLLGKYPIPSSLFETVAFDFLGPFGATEEGNEYILVITDYPTRFCVMFALPNKTTKNATTVVIAFFPGRCRCYVNSTN